MIDILNKDKIFIIAEIGVNHNGKLSIAKKLIDHASKAGCDAVKFQTYITDDIIYKTQTLAQYQKKTKFKNLVILKGVKQQDKRGYLRELVLEKLIKKKFKFQILSVSKKNVLRGLHFQVKIPQGKLISVCAADESSIFAFSAASFNL